MEPKRRIEKMDSVIRSGKMSNNNFYFLLSMDWRGNYRRRFVVNPVV